MARWFRFYDDALNDPKVQCLSLPLFKAWVNLLCVASKNDGMLPDTPALAFLLRQSASDLAADLAALKAAGLLDDAETGLEPHNWSERQYKSDVSTERSKQHRQRKRNVAAEPDHNVAATPSDTEQNQIQNRPVAIATGAVAPLAEIDLTLPPALDRSADLKTKLFGPCLDWLAEQSGKSATALRSMVGKWISDWGDGAVLEAFVAAQKESPVDPVAWIRRALESRNAKRNDYRNKPTAGQTARAGIAAALLTDA